MATMTKPMELNEGMSEGLRVEVRKVIRASRERVFEAWTKPEEIQHWFGPADMRTSEVEMDVRVGGSYRMAMQKCERSSGGEDAQSVATGMYREIVPNEKISFTWNGSWVPGEESLVTVKLKDAPEGAFGTEVTIVHERFLTTESTRGHEQGWVGSLGKLANYLQR